MVVNEDPGLYNAAWTLSEELTILSSLLVTPTPTPRPNETPATPTSTPIPSPTETAAPSPTSTVTDTPTAVVPYGEVKAEEGSEVNIRTGPGTDYPRARVVLPGQRLEVIGRSEDRQWWVVQVPDLPGGQAWISTTYFQTYNTANVPPIPAPPLSPTPTPIPPTATPTEPPTEAPPPTATPALYPSLPPRYGSINLQSGFTPDPYRVEIANSGRIVNVAGMGIGDCDGWAAEAPDFSLHWSGGGSGLRIYFVANSGTDTTLIVHRSSPWDWYCADDLGGDRNPSLQIDNATSNTYSIWVGSYRENTSVSGTLYISEYNNTLVVPTVPAPTDTPPAGGGELDPNGSPAFGETSLASGFTPDPYSIAVDAGGRIEVRPLNLGADCRGNAASPPDFSLNWSGRGTMRIFFDTNNGTDAVDTVLIVRDPFGNWRCNDDYTDLDPRVEFTDATSGQYDIWVATFSPRGSINGRLYITGQDLSSSDVP